MCFLCASFIRLLILKGTEREIFKSSFQKIYWKFKSKYNEFLFYRYKSSIFIIFLFRFSIVCFLFHCITMINILKIKTGISYFATFKITCSSKVLFSFILIFLVGWEFQTSYISFLFFAKTHWKIFKCINKTS